MVAVPRRVIVASLLSISFAAGAEEATAWGLGVGVASTQKPYTDIDRKYTPLPLLYFKNDWFRFAGTQAEIILPQLQLSETQQLNFGLIANYDGSGYDEDDSWIFDGMDKRKGGFWAGAKIEWQNEVVNIFTDWTHDISGNSSGQRIRLGAERSWQWGDVTLTPRIVANRYNRNYVDYYYGVRDDEARSWRPAYQGDASVNTEFGLNSVYRFNQHHALTLDVEVTLLGSEIKDSPLVDRTNENRIFASYIYHF